MMALRCSLQGRCPATSDKVLFFLALLQEMFNPTTKRFTLTVDGRPVCRKAFLIFWDIRDYTFKKLVRSIKHNEPLSVIHGNSYVHDTVKLDRCCDWLGVLVKYCEQQPDSEEIHLPERTYKADVYEEMVYDLSKTYSKKDIPAYQTFCAAWRKHFFHLKIPRVNRLGRCDVCCSFAEQIKLANGKQKSKLCAELKKHRAITRKERTAISLEHEKTKDDKEMWTSVCTDWSAPHFMPHRPTQPKGWMAKKRPKYHLFGLVNRSLNQLCLLPHFDFWTHDANLHLSFLYVYLQQMKQQNLLGRNLMIQMDNCWKDNKNKFLLGFAAVLVEKKIFSSVIIFYLQPGHSHDFVDAECFKPLGNHTRFMYGYWTPEEFISLFINKAWNRSERKPAYLEACVWDWKSWLLPNLRNISFHTFQRAFKITMQDEVPVLFYKKSILSSTWKGLENSTSGLQILTELPEGHPPHIPPTPLPEEDLEDLPSLTSMPGHVQTFWNDFTEEQFSVSYGSVPAFLELDFWGAPLEGISSSSSSEEESSVERPIHVTHHPTTVNLTDDLLQKNLAVRVSPDLYENSADKPDFWLAKLIDILPASSSGNRKIKVQWYQNIVSNNTNKFELLEDTDEILFSSVIWGNIELTNTGKIKKAHERKIYSVMNQ